MPHSLSLKSDGQPLSMEDFNSYFSRRDWYTVNGGYAGYDNTRTGAYFSFRLSNFDDCLVEFDINLCRPDIFGIEAARELSGFVTKFGLIEHRPHGDRPFCAEDFLRVWNYYNECCYKTR